MQPCGVSAGVSVLIVTQGEPRQGGLFSNELGVYWRWKGVVVDLVQQNCSGSGGEVELRVLGCRLTY